MHFQTKVNFKPKIFQVNIGDEDQKWNCRKI